MDRIVVTGGLGFIGSHIAEHFVSKGHEVIVIDNAPGHANISSFAKELSIVSASICDYEAVCAALKDARFVFHQAALVSVPRSMEDPLLTEKINVFGTRNILKAAKENGAERVILASSSAIYGDNEPPLSEDMIPRPMSPYAGSKLQNEKDALESYEKSGLATVSLRYFNVYGPRQDPFSQYSAAIPKFISALKNAQQPIVYGDGKQTRDFIYVKDVVKANVLASTAGKQALGKTVNVGSGKPLSILSLLEKLCAMAGREFAPKFEPARKGDIVHSYADTSLAKRILKFKCEWSIEKGLKETIASL